MPLILRPGTVLAARHDDSGGFRYGEHIPVQHRHHGSVPGFVALAAESRVQIYPVPFRQHARIKLGFVPGPLSQQSAVRIMHISVKFIFSRRRVADRHRHHRHLIQHIVQIVPAVRPHRHIRRVQAHLARLVEGIRRFLIDHALIAPVPQVVHRSRPAHIVSHAEHITIIKIMGTVHIHPVPKYIRLRVRDIFPGRQIGIPRLFFTHICLFSAGPYRPRQRRVPNPSFL